MLSKKNTSVHFSWLNNLCNIKNYSFIGYLIYTVKTMQLFYISVAYLNMLNWAEKPEKHCLLNLSLLLYLFSAIACNLVICRKDV